MRPAVIAIDGPASSGKSTIGHALAEYLGYTMLDSGLIYRLVAHQVLEGKVADPDDPQPDDEGITRTAESALAKVEIEPTAEGPQLVYGGFRLAELDLHSEPISRFVPLVGRVPEVRRLVRKVQQDIMASGPTILAGRDIGTVVAPDAELKLYLDVSLQERHASSSYAAIENAIVARDRMDRERSVSPLMIAADAVVICTDKMSVEETVATIVTMCDLQPLPGGHLAERADAGGGA
jgi:cytidylate kinase